MKQFGWQQCLIGLALAASCVLVGASIPTTNQALGEVTGRPEQPTFSTGSVPLLREIATTLHQMDGRLARLETIAQKIQSKASISAQRAEAAQRAERLRAISVRERLEEEGVGFQVPGVRIEHPGI